MRKGLAMLLALAMLATALPMVAMGADPVVWQAADVRSFNSTNEVLPGGNELDNALIASNGADGWQGVKTFTDLDGTVTTMDTLAGTGFTTPRHAVIAFTVPEGITSQDIKSVTLSMVVKNVKQVTANNRLTVYGNTLDTPWAGTTITRSTFGADSTSGGQASLPVLGLTDAIIIGNQTGESPSGQTITLSSKALTQYVRDMLDENKAEITFRLADTLGGIRIYAGTSTQKPTLAIEYGTEAEVTLRHMSGETVLGEKKLTNQWTGEAYTLTEEDAPLAMTVDDVLYARVDQSDIVVTPTAEPLVFDVQYATTQQTSVTIRTLDGAGNPLADDVVVNDLIAGTIYTYPNQPEEVLMIGEDIYVWNEGESVLSLTLAAADNVIVIRYDTFADGIPKTYTLAEEGATCWFGDPRSIHYENTDLGIDSTYMGYIDRHGAIKATQYDHLTGKLTEVLVRSNFQPDDHDNPTFLALPDGRIMIFYARHTDENCFFYRVTRVPGDLTTLGEEYVLATTANTTYPNPFLLSEDPDHIYLCWRGIGWHPTIGTLKMPDADGKTEWVFNERQIVKSNAQGSGCRPYAKYHSDGVSKIYITYTATHPDNVANNAIYANYIDITDMTLRDMKGAQLSDLKTSTLYTINNNETDPAYVVDPSSTSQRGWVWDIALAEDGLPVIAMVRISSDKQQHNYYSAKYDGTAWVITHLTYAGKYFHQTNGVEQCYSGGMSLNHENPREFYASVPVEGLYGTVYEIVKYTMNADYTAIESTEYITKHSQKNNVRPVFTRGANAGDDYALTWMNGDYYFWIVNSTYPLGYNTKMMTNTALPVYDATEVDATVAADEQVHYFTGDTTAFGSDTLNNLSSFTVAAHVKADSTYQTGSVLSFGDGALRYTWENVWHGSNGDQYSVLPSLTLGQTTQKSTNLLSNSDWNVTHGATTDGSKGTTNLGWFHLAITYDAATGRAYTYVNGLLDQCLQTEEELDLSGADILGGFFGSMTDVRVYDRALAQNEIRDVAAVADIDRLTEEGAYDRLSVGQEGFVYADMLLPATAEDGTAITWESSDTSLITNDGLVNRTVGGNVTLTATMNFSIIGQKTKEFVLTVPKRDSVDENLVLSYQFNAEDVYDDNGTMRVRDLSLSGLDGALMGNAAVRDGKLDLTANTVSAFETNGYMIVPAGVTGALRSYTFVSKVSLSAYGTNPRIYDFGSGAYYSVFTRANTLAAGIKKSDTQMITASQQIPLNQETYVITTYDASTGETKIYLNDQCVATGTNVKHEPAQLGADTRSYIGRTQWWDVSGQSANNTDLQGTIDDFRVYSMALSEADIAEILAGDEEVALTTESNTLAVADGALSGSVTAALAHAKDYTSAIAVLAVYDGDMLVGVVSEPIALTDGSGTATLTLSNVAVSADYSVKLMALSAFDKLVPITEALDLN